MEEVLDFFCDLVSIRSLISRCNIRHGFDLVSSSFVGSNHKRGANKQWNFLDTEQRGTKRSVGRLGAMTAHGSRFKASSYVGRDIL